MKRITSIIFTALVALSLNVSAEDKAPAPAAAPTTTAPAKDVKADALTPEVEAKKACEKEGKKDAALEACIKEKTAKKPEAPKAEEKAPAAAPATK